MNEGGTEAFTDQDRRRVRFVIEQVIDEMSDSSSFDGMFTPFAQIVKLALTDPQIAANLEDIVEGERLEVCRRCNMVEDANGDPHGPNGHTYEPYSSTELTARAVRKAREIGFTETRITELR
jgi:hypothetical protein